MKKYLIALLIGTLVTVLFAVMAGLGGGACHCAIPERVLFPYVSMLGTNADWEILANVLFWLQCPLYAVTLTIPRSDAWRAGVLLILLAAHGCAVAVAFQMPG